MTDNRALIGSDGGEWVWVNRSDGMAVATMRKMGLKQIILSTETNPVVAARAAKLDIPVLQGLGDKASSLARYAAEHGHDLARSVFIGNDVNDLAAMRLVGHPIAPAPRDARRRALAVFVTAARGGEGVVREFFESFLCGEAGAAAAERRTL